jgi:hypothetical protein
MTILPHRVCRAKAHESGLLTDPLTPSSEAPSRPKVAVNVKLVSTVHFDSVDVDHCFGIVGYSSGCGIVCCRGAIFLQFSCFAPPPRFRSGIWFRSHRDVSNFPVAVVIDTKIRSLLKLNFRPVRSYLATANSYR